MQKEQYLLPPEGVAKGVRTTVGCAMRTIPNKGLRIPNGAHSAPGPYHGPFLRNSGEAMGQPVAKGRSCTSVYSKPDQADEVAIADGGVSEAALADWRVSWNG